MDFFFGLMKSPFKTCLEHPLLWAFLNLKLKKVFNDFNRSFLKMISTGVGCFSHDFPGEASLLHHHSLPSHVLGDYDQMQMFSYVSSKIRLISFSINFFSTFQPLLWGLHIVYQIGLSSYPGTVLNVVTTLVTIVDCHHCYHHYVDHCHYCHRLFCLSTVALCSTASVLHTSNRPERRGQYRFHHHRCHHKHCHRRRCHYHYHYASKVGPVFYHPL